MLNKIWFALLLIGILYGFGKGAWNSVQQSREPAVVSAEKSAAADNAGAKGEVSKNAAAKSAGSKSNVASSVRDSRNLQEMGKDINAAIVNSATGSVELCLGLIGIMALWLGLLNVAKDAGLVDALARLLNPLMRWLFPEVPDGHPAQGAMLMNISANMLGIDNAATPLGLKAMQELQTLNPNKDTASNAMATFLAINTSNITIVPFTIIGYRVLEGSTDPALPIAGIILTTTVTTIVAVIAVRLLSKSSRYALPEDAALETSGEA